MEERIVQASEPHTTLMKCSALMVVQFLSKHHMISMQERIAWRSELSTPFLDNGVVSADAYAILSPIENIWCLGKNCESISTGHPIKLLLDVQIGAMCNIP